MASKAWIEELLEQEQKEESEKRKKWLEDGCCPQCGELGKFVNMGPVCSKHGPYDMVSKISSDKTFEEENEGA